MDVAVVVSGPPGAGKTSLAVPLASMLGLPLLAKDIIKERLYDSLPTPSDDVFTWSRTLGGAAMELLWTLAAYSPRVVLEANFRPRSTYERTRLKGLERPIIEVYCKCPAAVAAERFAERAKGHSHHGGAHPMAELTLEFLEDYDRPLALGEVIEVDTSRPVDPLRVAEEVTALLNV